MTAAHPPRLGALSGGLVSELLATSNAQSLGRSGGLSFPLLQILVWHSYHIACLIWCYTPTPCSLPVCVIVCSRVTQRVLHEVYGYWTRGLSTTSQHAAIADADTSRGAGASKHSHHGAINLTHGKLADSVPAFRFSGLGWEAPTRSVGRKHNQQRLK